MEWKLASCGGPPHSNDLALRCEQRADRCSPNQKLQKWRIIGVQGLAEKIFKFIFVARPNSVIW